MASSDMAGLYIHIPFCEHKCIYCDFYSIAPKEGAGQDGALVDRFLVALKEEFALRSEDPRFAVPFETVFFGGGTPSLLPASSIQSILDELTDTFSVRPDAEITLETNPGTVDFEKLQSFRSAGVNRLSIGVQSFHDDDLAFLTRIHRSKEAKECVQDAFRAGFENVSLDLIFSLPSQTKSRWDLNLRQAIDLNPTHISCYSLIVEPNTPLFRLVQNKQVAPVELDVDAELYEHTIRVLHESGYEQYEVSNFAKPGFKSLHNTQYWNHSPYLGFGPSAHSFWSADGTPGGAERWWNVSDLPMYIRAVEAGVLPIAGEERLSPEQVLQEELFLGLRSEGIDVAGFQERHGRDFLREQGQRVDRLIADGLAILEDGKFRLTARGYSVCDEISASLEV